jgi:DnaJ-class molecular chaperone
MKGKYYSFMAFNMCDFFGTIPSGIDNGAILRLRGMGRRMLDGQSGDLYLNVLIRDRDYNGNIH